MFKTNKNTNKDNKSSKKKNILYILIAIIAIIIAFILGLYLNDDLPRFDNADDWDGNVRVGDNSDTGNDSIAIVGYPSATITSENRTMPLINSDKNDVNIIFTVIDEDGTEVYKTDYIAPGKVKNADIYDKLSTGTHNLTIQYKTFDAKTNSVCTGANVAVTVTKE